MAEHAESPDIAVRPVLYAAGGSILFLMAVIGALAVAFPDAFSKPQSSPALVFPSPDIRSSEIAQRLKLEARQRAHLAGATGGIPINQAMERIAARGKNAFDPVVEPLQ